MKKQDSEKWAPKDELGRLIGKVPYIDPSNDLPGRILATLKPKKPGLVRQVVMWAGQPLNLNLSRALASFIIMALLLPGGFALYRSYDGSAVKNHSNGLTSVRPVLFHFNSEEAKSVAVMGSFNHWNPKGHELVWEPEQGRWSLQINLPPGKHDYVFIVNGEKVLHDPEADLVLEDDFGHHHSVLFVKGQNGIQI